MSTIVTPTMIYRYGSLFEPRTSKMNPDKATFYVQLLATAATIQTAEWLALERVVQDEGESYFGKVEYQRLLQSPTFRRPIRTDVDGKMPNGTVAFFNASAFPENRPTVYRRNKTAITDPVEIYPGCNVRLLMKVRGFGKGMPYPPGIRLQLEHVQKIGDGERLATARSDGSELGILPDDSDETIFN
jgi:ssDNA-binding protein